MARISHLVNIKTHLLQQYEHHASEALKSRSDSQIHRHHDSRCKELSDEIDDIILELKKTVDAELMLRLMIEAGDC